MQRLWRRQHTGRARRTTAPSMGRQLLWGGLGMSLLLLLCVGTWYVTRLPFFTITDIHITGGETVSHTKIRGMVEAQLAGTYFLVVPRTFTYLYPHEQIQEALRHETRIHSLVIQREGNNTLAISFEEYIPYALWCENETRTARCLFVDDTGYAFSPAPPMRGGAFMRHVVEAAELTNRTHIFDAASLENMETFIALLESQYPFRVLGATHSNETDIAYRLSGGGQFLVNNTMPATAVFENIVALLSAPEFAHIAPGNFDYIDLRFGNKVFVHEGIEEEIASSSMEAMNADEAADN